MADMKARYPAQTWAELCLSLKKYFCGISHIHSNEKMSARKRIRYFLRQLMPMKFSTYRASLASRTMVISTTDKVYLWLRVWQAKIHMAKAYLRCWMKHEGRP